MQIHLKKNLIRIPQILTARLGKMSMDAVYLDEKTLVDRLHRKDLRP